MSTQQTVVCLLAPCGWELVIDINNVRILHHKLRYWGGSEDNCPFDSLIIRRNFPWGFDQIRYFSNELKRVPDRISNCDDSGNVCDVRSHRGSFFHINKAFSNLLLKIHTTKRQSKTYSGLSE